MTLLSHKVADKLYLVHQQAPRGGAAKPVETATNHLHIYDRSGSMWGEIDRIKRQLKEQLQVLLKEGDTFTAIWFSGRGQFGIILEAEPISTLKDLREAHAKLDRDLTPLGLTGFKEPLEEAAKVIDRISKKNSNPFALSFLSDGMDNCWGRADILKAVEALSSRVQSSVFVEYGYYADRALLTAMAEKCGGSHLFAENFTKYEPAFESLMKKRPMGGKRVEVEIKGDAIGGFVYAMVDNDLVTYAVENGKVVVPEGVSFNYLSPTVVGLEEGDLSFNPKAKLNLSDDVRAAAYAAISLFALRAKPDIVFPLLKATGDVSFIETFANCFGKQKYSDFMGAAKLAAFDAKLRHTKGYDPKRVPREDAFTVLHVLKLLQEDESARVLSNSSDFEYKRIGRSRLDADELVSPEEQAEIDEITEQLKKTKDAKKIKVLNEKLTTLMAGKKDALKFVENDAPEGFAFDGWTFNENRPNISFRVKKQGWIDISDRLPDQFKGKKLGKIPEKFPTFVYRNYTVVKDGLVNIDRLPVIVSNETAKVLTAEGIFSPYRTEHTNPNVTSGIIDLKSLPIINRQMVTTAFAKDLFTKKVELTKVKAAQKVYNGYADELLPEKKSEGYVALYGDDAATWLKEQGFSEGSGFQPPKTVTAEATDQYMAKELKVSLKGFSSLPKVAEVRDKLASKGKVNAAGLLMKEAIEDVEGFLKSKAYTGADDKEKVLSAWLLGRKKATTNKCRDLMFEIAQMTMVICVGQIWFNEFSSIEEGSMELDVDGQKYDCKVEMKEFEVKI